MPITARSVEGVEILKVSGKLTIADGAPQLRSAVREALEAGKKNILLDLSEVTTIDSSGLGELISSYSTASQRDGKLKLLNPSRKLTDLLYITKLITVFEVHEEEAAAVKSFA